MENYHYVSLLEGKINSTNLRQPMNSTAGYWHLDWIRCGRLPHGG